MAVFHSNVPSGLSVENSHRLVEIKTKAARVISVAFHKKCLIFNAWH